MKHPLRIVLAAREARTLTSLQPLLARLGHQVLAAVRGTPDLLEQLRRQRPDLVLTDLELRGGNSVEALRSVPDLAPAPIILMVSDPDELLEADVEGAAGYLFSPVTEDALCSVILSIQRCFNRLQDLHQEVDELRQTLADRKLIEKAKGILARRLQIDEPDAFYRLRKLASNRNQKLVNVACQVLRSEEIFEALEQISSRTARLEGGERAGP